MTSLLLFVTLKAVTDTQKKKGVVPMAIINYIEKHLKTFNVRLHKHDYWEIIYTTEGVGSIKALNRVIEYKKDELILIPPNVWHTNNSSVGFKNIHFTIEDWYPSINEPLFLSANS